MKLISACLLGVTCRYDGITAALLKQNDFKVLTEFDLKWDCNKCPC
ncbi:DUF523 domain-containing protein [Candidatus Parcubacteria bacterium]|nr:DUF523 domain-containing protein [Candidatus Parcubacteria bacterium]